MTAVQFRDEVNKALEQLGCNSLRVQGCLYVTGIKESGQVLNYIIIDVASIDANGGSSAIGGLQYDLEGSLDELSPILEAKNLIEEFLHKD